MKEKRLPMQQQQKELIRKMLIQKNNKVLSLNV